MLLTPEDSGLGRVWRALYWGEGQEGIQTLVGLKA